ncbi:FAD-dependent monooxygenase [Candidatus Pelagibacter sp. Uisw_092]|uniref:FAD-dependent monooxygenase n=1 Tax=Candidatus Pelagibacter sp. Uisw_092 TaxID=3230979 RepID=UPI0039E7927C
MNVCIIGEGLTALSLAKSLINKKINVHYYHKSRIKNLSTNRTIGISKSNFEFFTQEIFQIHKKNYWKIKKIKICSEKLKNKNILEFENNEDDLFYMIKNYELYNSLSTKMSKNKFFKKIIIKKDHQYQEIINKRNYDLIVNCDSNSPLTKKYFYKKIDKDYYNLAYTSILTHEEIDNNTAIQTFTKSGPIAFLPISRTQTSVVCSLEIKDIKYSDSEVIDLINKHNPKYKINKIFKLSRFKLGSSSLRNYYYKNILAFGDILHRIHPLAGQGFNMTIRDIKILSEIIQNKIDLGLQLDLSILDDFEKKTKIKNFIFCNGIDFIYEVFNADKKIQNKGFNKILNIVGKNKNLTNYFIRLADRGLNF